MKRTLCTAVCALCILGGTAIAQTTDSAVASTTMSLFTNEID